jgi:hypothetical protein
MIDHRYQLLAALSGVAIKVIIAFVWERRQLTVTELEPRVGHDKNTVRKALAQLALYGLAGQVISSQETWCLTDKGVQLPLPLDALPAPVTSTSPQDALEGRGENFTTVTTTTALNPDIPTNAAEVAATRENFTANLKALHAHGIMGRKADLIAGLEWTTPDYIDAHVERVHEEGKRLGLAICRMESGDPAPSHEANDRYRYIEGRYADHIYH